MKKNLNLLAMLFATMLPLSALSDTTFFSDNFTNGSTINSLTPVLPTTNSASYQTIASQGWNPTSSVAPHDLRFGIGNAGGGNITEIQALFATNALALSQPGDFLRLTVVFTNFAGVYAFGAPSAVSFGLFNSGQVQPVPGGLNGNEDSGTVGPPSGTSNPTGGAQNWVGYMEQVGSSSNPNYRLFSRPAQTGTGNQNQDLTSNGSGTKSFTGGANLGTSTAFVTASTNMVYTDVFTITLNGTSSLAITNQLYTNTSVAVGTPATTLGGIATNANFLTGGFDGLAVGFYKKSDVSLSNVLDIASITVAGSVTVVSGPPSITLQPTPTAIAAGGAGAFLVNAIGFNTTYQWHRNGTNLTDGGNISGSTTPTLIVTSAGAGDALSGANGYYVTVSGTGGFSTNSVTNALSVITSTNLIWSGAAGTWDVNNTIAWVDTNGNPEPFNYGDPVTLDNTASAHTLNLVGNFLSASSVTMDATVKYILQSTGNNGSFAGPGRLLYKNSGQLDIKNANTYTGGTIISNSGANLFLDTQAGLGTGPVTLAKAGGTMDITAPGSASIGIGDVIVADDFTINLDAAGTFAGVIFGNLSGTVGKTLTFEETSVPFTNSRVRIYGTNTVYNGNLFIDGPATSQAQYSGVVLAAYGSSGSQTYNGVISGNGGFISRDSGGTTILAGPNTYSGGTTPSAGTIGFGIDSSPTVGTVTSGPIGTGPLNIAPEVNSANGNGIVFASGGARTIANPIQYPSATNNQLLVIGGTNDLTFTGTYTLNGLDGMGAPTNRAIQVNNTNGLTTISGVISDGGFVYGFSKLGVGKLALSTTETYTGPTLISGGTLAVNGALNAASAVTATNGILGGTGTVNGTVTIQNGGGIAPGNSIGTLTINNSLTIQGGSTNNFEVNKTAGTKDLVNVTGNVTYNGTLFATNLAGTLTTADSFKIFNVTGTKTGTFTNIIGSPGAGLLWSFTNSSGVLGIINGFNPGPGTNIIATVTGGNNLNLSWGGIGWRLQVQTNSLATGLSNNWSDVPNSTSINSTNFIINPTKGNVYYRLIYP